MTTGYFNKISPFYANENELFHIAVHRIIDTVTLPENFYAKERFYYHKVQLHLHYCVTNSSTASISLIHRQVKHLKIL